jgi:hypothetical protein
MDAKYVATAQLLRLASQSCQQEVALAAAYVCCEPDESV